MATSDWKTFNRLFEELSNKELNSAIPLLIEFIEHHFEAHALFMDSSGQIYFGNNFLKHANKHTISSCNAGNFSNLNGHSYALGQLGNLYISSHKSSHLPHDMIQAICAAAGVLLKKTFTERPDTGKSNKQKNNLQNREALFRYMLRHMNLGIIEFDTERIIQYANRTFSKISGYMLSELIGRNMDEFPFSNWEQISEYHSDPTDVFLGKTFEIAFTNRQGFKCHWLISGSQIFNEHKQLTGIIGIVLDISMQKQLQHELAKQKEAAEKVSLAKERFLTTISHEIRNPLNVIIGSLRELAYHQRNGISNKPLKSALQSADYLLALLNNIIDYTALDDDDLIVQETKFVPQQIVQQVADYYVNSHANSELEIKLNMQSQGQLLTQGNEAKIKQILYALIGNAVKFTRKGKVEIICSVMKEDDKKVHLKIEIKDNGEGIKPEKLSSLLKKEKFDEQAFLLGDGMGLNLINKIVQHIKGKMQIKSQYGIGTTIELILPLKIVEQHKLSPNLPANTSPSDTKITHVLVVEDQLENQKLVEMILRRHQIKCDFASNGIHALKKLEQNQYDLILMDIQMPEMDGITATKLIRSNISASLPIIAVTANAFSKDVMHYLKSGMNDVLVKPYGENELIEKINCHLMPPARSSDELENKKVADKIYSLKSLKELSNGDQAFLNEMIQLFIDITPLALKDLGNAIERQKFSEAAKVAHRMKQSIGNMGMPKTKEKVVKIELMCKSTSPDTQQINALFESIKEELYQCLEQLKSDFKK